MTELDEELPDLVQEIIAEYGKDLLYKSRVAGAYNPATSSSTIAIEELQFKGIVEPYRGQRMLAGLVEVNDLKVTSAANIFPDNLELTPGDIIEIDTEDYNVISILPTYSGELKALYEFQVRRS